jgi:hypothetical protein
MTTKIKCIILLLFPIVALGAAITSFNTGEVSPKMLRRKDFQKYDSSLQTLQNMLINVEGPVERRPGTKYIATVKDAYDDVRLLKFEQSKTDAYIIEAGDEYFRFYRNGGQILDANDDVYELETDFQESDLPYIQYVQNANVMYLVDGNDPPQKLTRTDHDDWTIEDVNYTTGPFLPENGTTTTVEPNGLTGDITITASADIFDGDHVGALWRIGYVRDDIPLEGTLSGNGSSSAIEIEGTYYYNIQGTWKGDVIFEKSYDDGSTYETVYPRNNDSTAINEDFDDSEADEDVLYRVTMENYTSGSAKYYLRPTDNMVYGIVRITGYVDGNEVTVEVLSTLQDANTTTDRWSEGAWSDYRGWPQTIEFYEQRIFFGGSRSYPQTIWTTKTASGQTDDYEDMTAGVDDDDALIYILPGQNPIQWMEAQDQMLIGTLAGVGKWGSPDADKPITPTEPTQFKMQALYGAEYMQAEGVGDSVLYVERGGHRIREVAYSLESDKYVAPNLSQLAEHIAGDGIVDIAYQSRPTPILWCATENGPLLSLTYERPQEVVGWAWHTPWRGSIFYPSETDSILANGGSSSLGDLLLINYEASSSWLAAGIDEDGTVVDIVDDIDSSDTYAKECYISPYTGKFYILNTSSGYDCGYYTSSIYRSSSLGTVSIGDTVTGSVGGGTYLVHDIMYDDDSQCERGTIVLTIVSGAAPVAPEVFSVNAYNYVTTSGTPSTDYDVVKFNADGTIDTTWGDGGFKNSVSGPIGAVIEDEAGNTYFGSTSNASKYMVLFSLDPDGLLKWGATHADDGLLSDDYPSTVRSLALSRSEGTLYVGCYSYSGYGIMAVATSSGSPILSWGSSGYLLNAGVFNGSDNIVTLIRDPNSNEIYASHDGFLIGATYYSVTKVAADGTVDTTWGTNGHAGDDLTSTGDYVTRNTHALCFDENGYLFYMGYDFAGGVQDRKSATVIYYDEDGTAVDSFTITAEINASEVCLHVKDDYVYVGGKSRTRGSVDSTVIRYEYDGTLDTSYTPASLASSAAYANEIIQIADFDVYYSTFDANNVLDPNNTSSKVLSVETIPGADEDEVWMVVRRAIGDTVTKYVEQIQPRDFGDDVNDAYFLDCGLSWDGGAATTITNISKASPAVVTVDEWPTDGEGTNLADGDHVKILGVKGMTQINSAIYTVDDANTTDLTLSLENSIGGTDINSVGFTTYIEGGTVQRFERSFTDADHLAGETVGVYGDGRDWGTATVATDGSFSIQPWVNKLLIGIPYTSALKTVPIIVELPTGSNIGKVGRITGVNIDFLDSLGVEYGQDSTNLSPVKFYDDSQSKPWPWYTGWVKQPFQHGYSRDHIVYLETDAPLPFTLRAIVPDVEYTER